MFKFFEEKNTLRIHGFKFFWIFEVIFLKELKSLYGTKMVKLEEKLGNIESASMKKLGDLLRCYSQKKFEEPLKGVKIVHVASRNGFSEEDIVLLESESTDKSKQQKCEHFIETFKKIISNVKLIPDKSCIVLSREQWSVVEIGGKKTYLKDSQTMKKREMLSRVTI